MRHGFPVVPFALALVAALFLATPGRAQHRPHAIIGAGVGGTFYSIGARTDEGTAFTGLVAYGPIPLLRAEASVRAHDCFDCDGDLLAEAGLQLYSPGATWQPYVGAGAGYCFGGGSPICDEVTGYAAIGVWAWFARSWGVRPELRYRRVGSGDMGELSLAVGRRLQRTGP